MKMTPHTVHRGREEAFLGGHPHLWRVSMISIRHCACVCFHQLMENGNFRYTTWETQKEKKRIKKRYAQRKDVQNQISKFVLIGAHSLSTCTCIFHGTRYLWIQNTELMPQKRIMGNNRGHLVSFPFTFWYLLFGIESSGDRCTWWTVRNRIVFLCDFQVKRRRFPK